VQQFLKSIESDPIDSFSTNYRWVKPVRWRRKSLVARRNHCTG